MSPGTRRALHQCLYSSTTIHLLHNRENVILEKSEEENIWMLHLKVNPTLLTSFKLPCIMFSESEYYLNKIFTTASFCWLKTIQFYGRIYGLKQIALGLYIALWPFNSVKRLIFWGYDELSNIADVWESKEVFVVAFCILYRALLLMSPLPRVAQIKKVIIFMTYFLLSDH